MMNLSSLSSLAILITLCESATLWVYDPTNWRHTPDAILNVGSTSTIDSQTLEECKGHCERVGYTCLSFTWNGDVDTSTAKSSCRLYKTRFGFKSGGLDQSDTNDFGSGDLAMLEGRDRTNYFEKPMDLADNLGDQLIANGLRINNKDYATYASQTNNLFNYNHFLMYYRAGIPGYVNNSDSRSKYSVIVEYEAEDAEECAMYCTRERGLIDASLGTRCVSFNYNTDGRCHLLSFSMDGGSYNIGHLPSSDAEEVTSGWFYFEALQGEGCWVVQSQCRKWDDAGWVAQQRTEYTVGVHVGVIREYATDDVCSKCFNSDDFQTEFEYICLDKARTYHEDYCDNDADSATVAYWGQDGAGVAEIWNSWDLSQGCVIDLSEFKCSPDQSKYNYTVPNPNTRFEGKKFRDSIGEEEFAAGIDKKRCWERANAWYSYCELGGQSDFGDTVYLNVSWPSDGSWYLEPPIKCTCDQWGLKREKDFGMVRDYCTRESTKEFCYRENQEDYWAQIDLLCDDVAEGFECYTDSGAAEGTGCYLFYPVHQTLISAKDQVSYVCAMGGRYDFESESFIVTNDIAYREVLCDEQNLKECGEWTEETCGTLAEQIHNSCGNGLEDESEQIIVWYRATGDVMTFPSYALPYETTVIRGLVPGAKYTVNMDKILVDMMPIRNGRWMAFSPDPLRSGNLRQIDAWYENELDATLTCTIWYGYGVTKSIFLNQVTIDVVAQEAGWVRFPVDDITITEGAEYTWQITSSTDDPTKLGFLGYVRGNGYKSGVGDMAWDYLFVAWVEGSVTSGGTLLAVDIGASLERPWFEIWCIMIMVLFLIFAVFLCILHWKRKYDEDQERKEDRKFQAELRQRAMLQAEAERNARKGNVEEEYEDDEDDDDGGSRTGTGTRTETTKSEPSEPEATPDDYPEEYDDAEYKTKQDKKNANLLSPGDPGYDRVKSYSKNEMPGGDGYQDGDKKKGKKKKRKKKGSDADYEEY